MSDCGLCLECWPLPRVNGSGCHDGACPCHVERATRTGAWTPKEVVYPAIVPMEDDIVYLGNERHTYVSQAASYDSSLRLWEIIDDQGEALIVYFVREEFQIWKDATRPTRYVWHVKEI